MTLLQLGVVNSFCRITSDYKMVIYQDSTNMLPASDTKQAVTFFILMIFILLRLECIKYIKYGTSSMLILDKMRDKIVD